jgi:hypothetical protein
MAPKPRPVQRKLSTAGKDGTTSSLTKSQNSQSMPPPPVPILATAPPPQGLLVPEAVALSSCLKVSIPLSRAVELYIIDSRSIDGRN